MGDLIPKDGVWKDVAEYEGNIQSIKVNPVAGG